MAFTPRVRSLPHARGGVSPTRKTARIPMLSSPRTWGCFPSRLHAENLRGVFPTHVGVFLPYVCRKRHPTRLPHARGGVSVLNVSVTRQERSSPRTWGCFSSPVPYDPVHGSSPRTWGCFRKYASRRTGDDVFPTHVGVFLVQCLADKASGGLPHARGGVSKTQDILATNLGASPHMWGSP